MATLGDSARWVAGLLGLVVALTATEASADRVHEVEKGAPPSSGNAGLGGEATGRRE